MSKFHLNQDEIDIFSSSSLIQSIETQQVIHLIIIYNIYFYQQFLKKVELQTNSDEFKEVPSKGIDFQYYYDEQNYNNDLVRHLSNSFKESSEQNQQTLTLYNSQDQKQMDKQSKQKNRKKTSHSNFYSSLLVNQQKKLNFNKRFYLFMDQVVDIDFLKNYTNSEYIKENKQVSLHKGLRFINQIVHRMDNKYIEVDQEYYQPQNDNVDMIINMLKSLGNKDLLGFIDNLQKFFNGIQQCKKSIKQQSDDIIFIKHQENRKNETNLKFNQITSQFSQNDLIFYVKLEVNYEKLTYETSRIGYSPGLYEILDINSYSFKDILSKNDFQNAHALSKNEECFNSAMIFLNPPTKPLHPESGYIKRNLEIRTRDNFIFPAEARIRMCILTDEYDQSHNLNLKFKDYLIWYEYTFQDPIIQQNFNKYRNQQLYEISKPITIYNDKNFDDFVDYQKTEFFQKYYNEQIENLVASGNKWFKRCGYVNIPIKKNKRNYKDYEQGNFEETDEE